MTARRCRTFLGHAAFGGICPVISVVTIIHTMVTRVNRKDPNFSLILQRIKNHMRKKAYDSVIQSKKNRSGTGDVGKKQCCTRRTPLLRLTLLYRKNRLHYGKRFHTNCYSASIFTIPCKSAGTAVRICILFKPLSQSTRVVSP